MPPNDSPDFHSFGVNSSPQESLVHTTIRRISPYKELITIVAFFSAGGLWMLGYFATQRQVMELRCFAQESIALARTEFAIRTSFDELVTKGKRKADLSAKSKANPLSEEELLEQTRLERQVKDLESKYEQAQKRFDSAEKSLIDGQCTLEVRK